MTRKYKEWHKNLIPSKRLVVSFSLNWFFWLIAWLLAEQFFFDEKLSWKYLVFHATWMSILIAIPFNWKELKEIFK